jgi:predicted amidohydrolase
MKQFVNLVRVSIVAFIIINTLTMEKLGARSDDERRSVVLTGLQMSVTGDIKSNKEQIIAGIHEAVRGGADFLVTPEGSLSGYTSNFNQADVKTALDEITSLASKMKVGLMLGTCYKEFTGGKEFCYNQVRVYTPEGKYLGAHSKILRCSKIDMPGTGEMMEYAEGILRTFDWNGLRFGILICNDLWATPGYTTMPNPFLVLKLKEMGAQFIVHCINSGTEQRYRPFHESSAELWAHSVSLPILEVNAAHGDEIINARSGLIEANGERSLNVPDSGIQVFTVRVNLSDPEGLTGQK